MLIKKLIVEGHTSEGYVCGCEGVCMGMHCVRVCTCVGMCMDSESVYVYECGDVYLSMHGEVCTCVSEHTHEMERYQNLEKGIPTTTQNSSPKNPKMVKQPYIHDQ